MEEVAGAGLEVVVVVVILEVDSEEVVEVVLSFLTQELLIYPLFCLENKTFISKINIAKICCDLHRNLCCWHSKVQSQ